MDNDFITRRLRLMSSIITYIELHMTNNELYDEWLYEYEHNMIHSGSITAEEHYKLISPFVYG